MKVLGIETSCDETSVAVVEDGKRVLSNIIASQVDLHAKYGGVVPEVASRKHLETTIPVLQEALREARIGIEQVDVVAVTYGPGLAGSLLVGVSFAKSLAFSIGVPLVGVNHLEAHMYANFIGEHDIKFPVICLIVSGGHTDIVLVKGHGDYRILGATRDDAVGEAFDKVARFLGLGYPGGPIIDNLSQKGNPRAIAFPKAFLEPDNFDFSFSGLKTAVVNYVEKNFNGEGLPSKDLIDIVASFQQTAIEVLVEKTVNAALATGVNRVVLAGGVASNSLLRKLMLYHGNRNHLVVSYPPPILCTDNAAMVAAAGYYSYINGKTSDLDLNAIADLQIGND